METNTQALVDRQQIVELCSRYARAVDLRDFAEVARCFTTDGALETVIPPQAMRGQLEIERRLSESTSRVIAAHHLVTDHLYEILGDTAHGASSFVMFRWPRSAGSAMRATVHTGRYLDELSRSAEGWRIKDRRIEILWGPGEFLPPARRE